MKAIQIHAYGDSDQLELEEVPNPKPGPGEVLVRMQGASINPIDFKIRSGAMKDFFPQSFPVILGRDLAGTVEALGPGVSGFSVGDRVMGLTWRTYAELVPAKANDLCRIPKDLEFVQAAALPLVITTGAQLIEKGGNVSNGQMVLITGAVGSVGRTAVFVAKMAGASVIAGVRRAQLRDAQGLGADQVLALDDDAALAGLPELDVVADTVGHETIVKLLSKIKKGGTLASVVGVPPEAKGRDLRIESVMAQPDSKRLEQLASAVAEGRLKIPVGKVLHLSEIREGHRLAEKGNAGKIVLIP